LRNKRFSNNITGCPQLIAGEYPQLIAYYPVGKFKIESAKTDTIYENR